VWESVAVRWGTSVLRCAAEEWRPSRCVHRQDSKDDTAMSRCAVGSSVLELEEESAVEHL
jgi:hypothetical protein